MGDCPQEGQTEVSVRHVLRHPEWRSSGPTQRSPLPKFAIRTVGRRHRTGWFQWPSGELLGQQPGRFAILTARQRMTEIKSIGNALAMLRLQLGELGLWVETQAVGDRLHLIRLLTMN